MKFLSKYKGEVGLLVGLAVYVVLLQVSGIHCPIKYLCGISCPGCGMSRALLSALRLELSAAFAYNPAWPALLICAAVALVLKLRGRLRASRLTLAVLLAVLLAVYAVRLFAGGEVVVFAPEEGKIYQFFVKVLRL
jgi:hypothetical protein